MLRLCLVQLSIVAMETMTRWMYLQEPPFVLGQRQEGTASWGAGLGQHQDESLQIDLR
jgi:hypothetical protein